MRSISPTRSHLSASALVRKTRRILMEALEPRELLSALTVATNGKSATFTDVDGDVVTVAITKGKLTTGLFTMGDSGIGEQIQELDLSATSFSGTNLTISVVQNGTGDGLTNVGYINAGTHALGKTVISGDVGRIDAGTGTKLGISSLSVFSMGVQGLDSQGGSGSLESDISSLGSLSVTTDIDQAFIYSSGNIGNVKVGGSLIGGTAEKSGSIAAHGSIGSVFIGQNLSASNDVGASGATYSGSIEAFGGSIGNVTVVGSVLGGSAYESGDIYADKKMGKVTIGGSIVGGSGDYSAEIDATSIASASVGGSVIGGDGTGSGFFDPGALGNVTIGGSLIGGDGESSGSLNPDTMANITIGGSIIGGVGADSGSVFAGNGNIGKVTVEQNLIGGDYSGTASSFTGYIEAIGKIAGVFIGGNVTAGNNTGGGTLESGSIRASSTIGSVQINGNLTGTDTQDAIIAAGANGKAIGSVLIGGSVDEAQILAGYITNQDTSNQLVSVGTLVAMNGGAKIGKITVDNNWTASSVMAGTQVGTDTLPGTSDDTPILGADSGKGAIGSINILGEVFGTAASGDHFGFISSSIGSFTEAGVKAPLTKGKDSLAVPGTDDVTILEV